MHDIHCSRTECINAVRFSKTLDEKENVFFFFLNNMPTAASITNLSTKHIITTKKDIWFGKWILLEFKSHKVFYNLLTGY